MKVKKILSVVYHMQIVDSSTVTMNVTTAAGPSFVNYTFFGFCSMNAEMNGTLVEVTFKTGLPEIPPGVIKVNRKSNKLEILQC